MFEQLWEESPTVQKMRAQYYEKGEVQTLQRTLVEFVQVRFPVLTELAQRQAQLCKKPEVLQTVTRQLFAAQDEWSRAEIVRVSVRDLGPQYGSNKSMSLYGMDLFERSMER